MKELEKTYNPSEIEDRLYRKWLEKGYFHAEVDRSRKPFTIVMPPPNITGQLHMGHALDNTLQDILIRFKRMQGYNALWQPGTDHASIATEVKVTAKLKEEGIDGLSPEFKDLFLKMVAFEPSERPTIKEILNHDWMKEVSNLNEEEFKQYEEDLISELKEREENF